ncbi:hypothetical protein [Paludibaculum fermentans]|uniref:hypothetical protein n=1 Tax=Paludibaculum fermentans TaxID=1473598 RepID=UPI003EB82636
MMLRNWLLLGTAILSLVQVGCAQGTRYPLRLYDFDERQLLEKATTVVVAKTVGFEWEAASQSIHWSKQYGVQSARLVKVKLSVEQVIRGSAEGAEMTAYYWAPEYYTNGSSLHLPMQGERAVHYFVTDQGVLRYVTDLVRSTSPVFTGYHHQPPKARGTGAEAKIAAVLLTPGEGTDIAMLVTNLSTATGGALQLVGYVGTLPLLAALADNPVEEIRWEACVEFYRGSFEGHDGCIDKLASEAVEHGRKAELLRLQSQRMRGNQAFRQAFLSDPFRTAKQYAVLPGDSGIADFLNMLTQHPDKGIADRAREALRTCCRNGPA